jgi:Lsr2
MAERRTTSLVDDLTGTAATETVRFGFGGPDYEIDLSADHAADLRSRLAPYMAKARRIRRGHVTTPRRQVLRIGVTVDPGWTGNPTQ